MALTHIEARVDGPAGNKLVPFLVDSGATYTSLPQEVWSSLGIEPGRRRLRIRLADGTVRERQMGACRVEIPGEEAVETPTILGAEGDLPLLGAVTLEEAGLMLDPLQRRLLPMRVSVPTMVAIDDTTADIE